MYSIQHCKVDLWHSVFMPLSHMSAKGKVQIANSHGVHMLTNSLSKVMSRLAYIESSTLALQKIDHTLRLNTKTFPFGKVKKGSLANDITERASPTGESTPYFAGILSQISSIFSLCEHLANGSCLPKGNLQIR